MAKTLTQSPKPQNKASCTFSIASPESLCSLSKLANILRAPFQGRLHLPNSLSLLALLLLPASFSPKSSLPTALPKRINGRSSDSGNSAAKVSFYPSPSASTPSFFPALMAAPNGAGRPSIRRQQSCTSIQTTRLGPAPSLPTPDQTARVPSI